MIGPPSHAQRIALLIDVDKSARSRLTDLREFVEMDVNLSAHPLHSTTGSCTNAIG